nr:PREDICTED: uncharacterized protein LOC109040446 isoform X1 [Bemisia tabaci]
MWEFIPIVDIDCELIISPVKQVPIRGEVNLLKFFNRVVNEALGIRADMLQETVLESVLDSCHRLSHSKHTNEYEKLLNNLSSFINKSESFSENNSTLIDLTLWSIISRRRKLSLPTGLKDWYDGVTNFLGVKF